MLRLQLLQLAKFAGVLLFVGGAVAACVAREPDARRIAVHKVGSAGVGLMWIAGALLAMQLGYRLAAPWLLAAFATTLATHLVLTWAVARERNPAPAVAVLVLATLVLMIWKP